MGKHSKKVLAGTTMPDSQVDGLTWDITVVPDTDCTDGMDMYQGHGTLWRWVIVKVTPIIDGHAYAGAHGGTVGYGHMRNAEGWMAADLDTLINGNRWYTHDVRGLTLADRYEVIPPIVPVLIEQAREALPDVISRHSWQAQAVAEKITELTLGEWTDDQDAEPGMVRVVTRAEPVRGTWAERALAEAVDGAHALAEDGEWNYPTDVPARDYGRSQDLASFGNVYFNAKALHDGMDGETNPQYTRAMAELIIDSFGLRSDDKERLMADIAGGTA